MLNSPNIHSIAFLLEVSSFDPRITYRGFKVHGSIQTSPQDSRFGNPGPYLHYQSPPRRSSSKTQVVRP